MHSFVTDDWMDSTLSTSSASIVRPATLTLKVKVYLQKENAQSVTYTSDGETHTQNTIDWDAESWRDWRRGLTRTVNAGWSDKLWLQPDGAWMEDASGNLLPDRGPVPIRLRLRINCDVTRVGAHVIIRSFRLPEPTAENPDPFWRSNMMAPFIRSHRDCSIRGNDVIGNMDNRDLLPKSTGQIAALHEFGHYIGLSHVNAAAANSDPNGTDAYGEGTHQRGDIMGAGTRIEEWHAYPWCQRLRRHLRTRHPQTGGWHCLSPIQYLTGRGGRRVCWSVRRGQVLPAVLPPAMPGDRASAMA